MNHIVLCLVLALTAAPPAPHEPPPQRPRAVLVFSKTAGFRHASIPDGVRCISAIADAHHLACEHTENADDFNDENLARFGVVVFLSTTGDVLNDHQQAAFERFIRAGGGFVGVHAAADTEYDWPFYGELVGAYFKTHPRVQQAEIDVLDTQHPSCAHLGQTWTRTDEWYDYRSAPRDNVRLLLELDEGSYEGATMGGDHPIAWCHEFSGGRAFYTGGGHTSEAYSEPDFVQHLAGGIAWAGDWDLELQTPTPAPEAPRPVEP